MASDLDQQVGELVKDQLILENYPDDYLFHPLFDPLIVKIEDQVMVGVLAREDGKEGANFNQVALMTPLQFSEFIRTLPDAKLGADGSPAKRTEFTGNQVWQDGVTGTSVSANDYSKVFFDTDTGKIADDAIAVEANAQWARKGYEERPRPYNEILLTEGKKIGEIITNQDLLIETDVMGKLEKGRVLDSYGVDESKIEVPEGSAKYYYDVSTMQIVDDRVAKRGNEAWDQNKFEEARPFDFAVLPNKLIRDGRVDAQDLQSQLNEDYRLVDERVTVHSDDSLEKMKASEFLKNMVININAQAEHVAIGKRDADLTVSSSEVENSDNIYVEQGYQPRGNVIDIPQELLDHLNKAPAEEPKSVNLAQDFKSVSPDVSYAPRPDITAVDNARQSYKDLLASNKSDENKTAEINSEVGGSLLRYLSREKNFDGKDPAFFKDELHEAISDLKSLGLNEQAVVLEQYEKNIDNGMSRRDAREAAQGDLKEISEQVHSVSKNAEPSPEEEAQSRADAIVERDLQDKLAKSAMSESWIKESFDTLNNSDEAQDYKKAMMSGEGVEEAKANLDKLVDDLKRERFPDHKSIVEREAEREAATAMQAQVSSVLPALEAAFFEKIQNAGIGPDIDSTQKQAFADAVMKGLTADDVQKQLAENPDNTKKVLADSIISNMDAAIDDLKQGLYDNQDKYRESIGNGIRDVVNSPEFQKDLTDKLDSIKQGALDNARSKGVEYAEDLNNKAEAAMEAVRRENANPDYEKQKQKQIDSFKNLPKWQRDAALDRLEKYEVKNDGLTQEQQVLKDALLEIAESDPSVPAAAGGMKP